MNDQEFDYYIKARYNKYAVDDDDTTEGHISAHRHMTLAGNDLRPIAVRIDNNRQNPAWVYLTADDADELATVLMYYAKTAREAANG